MGTEEVEQPARQGEDHPQVADEGSLQPEGHNPAQHHHFRDAGRYGAHAECHRRSDRQALDQQTFHDRHDARHI